jgi:glycosyltransferase involved in cell wall biosynthesis
MIAPEPFFQPRGTPFSEYHRIRALADLGHTVDLVTYPIGEDKQLPGLRVFRCLRPPFIHDVKIGPSLAKIPLDLAIALTTIRRALSERYDAVHSHEEAGIIGVIVAWMLGVPHLYDMHSSLPQQLSNFAFTKSVLITRAFTWMERFVIRRSRVVIVICPQLEETVRAIDDTVPTVLIENAPGAGESSHNGSTAAVRDALALSSETPVVLYTGTFEAYQGLNLLFEAARMVAAERPDVRFVMVGGRPEQVTAARERAAALGLAQAMIFTGERPAEEIPSYLDAADVLVSPRSQGTNTPLKIYQYLRSGRAIVATRLLTHTQVLDDSVAFLTPADAAGFARGILDAVSDPAKAREVASRAKLLAETKYSYEAYLTRTRQACAYLEGPAAPLVAGDIA